MPEILWQNNYWQDSLCLERAEKWCGTPLEIKVSL